MQVIKRLTVNYDTPRQYQNFSPDSFLIFVVVRCHVNFKVGLLRGVSRQYCVLLISVASPLIHARKPETENVVSKQVNSKCHSASRDLCQRVNLRSL